MGYTSPSNFQRRSGGTGSTNAREQYLESTIRSASPARLRLMLIEKSIGVAGVLAEHWRSHPESRGANEHSILLLDLLTELLSGVTSQEADVCIKVADLYVFLCKQLVAAEQSSDASRVDGIRDVLLIEADTWREVCAREHQSATIAIMDIDSSTVSTGLNLHV